MAGIGRSNNEAAGWQSAAKRLSGKNYVNIQITGVGGWKSATARVRPKLGCKTNRRSRQRQISVRNRPVKGIKAVDGKRLPGAKQFAAQLVVDYFGDDEAISRRKTPGKPGTAVLGGLNTSPLG